MSNEREYCVIVKDKKDLDTLYDQMESTYQDEFIPSRKVELSQRRPISRSTRYYLTKEEAETLSKHPLIKSVSLSSRENNFVMKPFGLQYSDYWDKSPYNDSEHVNWGLLRSYKRGKTDEGWGADGTYTISDEIVLTNTGKNVDVVICDGHFPHDHPEFAKNPNGTGGSRVVPLNWFLYAEDAVGVEKNIEYQYDLLGNPTANGNNDHGANVAAIAAGNTCGFARDANIYNINPYNGGLDSIGVSSNNEIFTDEFINYIRAWHNTKPINPSTGKKNPTILNASIGFSKQFYLPYIDGISYQGSIYLQPDTGWGAYTFYLGLHANDGYFVYLCVRDDELDNDMQDAINDGIICVSAAGNLYGYNDIPGGRDYDNFFFYLNEIIYYQRGASPAASPGVINVSAIAADMSEHKADFSNAGPRTDIFAAGVNIMGAHVASGVPDFRDRNFLRGKSGGTSQACPQVCGILAAAMERYPRMTQSQALDYLLERGCTQGQLAGDFEFNTVLYDSIWSYIDWTSLFGGPNKYAAYYNEKQRFGQVFPKNDVWLKPREGRIYPRTGIRRTR